LKTGLRALSHRNYRLYFFGQIFSLIGTWIQFVAMSWLVYRLSNSAFLLGLTGFVSQIPILLLAPFAGVLSDRLNRHRTLMVTQTLAMLQAFALATLTFLGSIEIWQIIALAGLLGVINAFDVPTRQSFIVHMIGSRDHLQNAIALNSFTMNATRLIGPSIGGLLVAAVGEGFCFLLNGLSFLAILASLKAMRIDFAPVKQRSRNVWIGLSEGFRYAFGFRPIRMLLLELAIVSFMAMPYTVLMPIFAAEVFQGTARTYGILIGCAGFGAILATVFLASRKSVQGLGNVIVIAGITCGVALTLFSRSNVLWLSQLLMVFVGFGIICHAASINTILQTIVDEDKRGRIMSFYTMFFVGMAPIGSLVGGQVANLIGVQNTFTVAGMCCVLAAVFFASRLHGMRESIRPLPALRGIIP
jgi:MFS family permease